jgi:hypothetical protein
MKDLKLHNDSENILTAVVEPWAEEILVNPKSILRLQVNPDAPASSEIVYQEAGCITVWLWRGCTVVAYIDEQKADMPSLLIRTPFQVDAPPL